MHTRSLTLLSVLALGFIVLPAPSAHACSCIPPGSVPEEVEKTDVIFMGEVTAVTEESDTSFRVTFDLERKWKGLASQETIDIWTPHDSAQCGYAFKVGESYVVYASEDMRVNLCSSTKQKSEATEDIAYLEAITQDASVLSFPDVPSVHVHAEAIAYLKNTGMVHGHPDGTYRPDDTINRAEFTKIVTAATNSQATIDACLNNIQILFSDTPLNAWFAPYVCTAFRSGAVTGYPDQSFRPANPVNMAEAAKILVMIFEVPFVSHDDPRLVDYRKYTGDLDQKKNPYWWQYYIVTLQDEGILPSSYRGPAESVTRGEMAEMIFRIQTRIER